MGRGGGGFSQDGMLLCIKLAVTGKGSEALFEVLSNFLCVGICCVWLGYVYHVNAHQKGGTLKIQNYIPDTLSTFILSSEKFHFLMGDLYGMFAM